jgi:hypothetical protein
MAMSAACVLSVVKLQASVKTLAVPPETMLLPRRALVNTMLPLKEVEVNRQHEIIAAIYCIVFILAVQFIMLIY